MILFLLVSIPICVAATARAALLLRRERGRRMHARASFPSFLLSSLLLAVSLGLAFAPETVRATAPGGLVLWAATTAAALAVVWRLARLQEEHRQACEARRHAEETSRLKSALLSNVADEIRTSAASIAGLSSLLADEVGEEQRELVRYVDQSGRRLLDTLNAMNDLSLLEAGDPALQPELLNVCEAAEAVTDRMRRRAREKGLRLRFHADAPTIWARLDRLHLDRILHKLVDNAIRFTEQGHVTVGVHERGRRVEICVEHTGAALGAPLAPHPFEATAADGPVTGPGVALTKRLVERLGGTIRVERGGERGGTCVVSFPLPHQQARLLRRDRPRRRSGELAGLPCSTRVLIIDPSPVTPSYVGLLLGQWCSVAAAPDERGALGLLRERRFDLVLVNVDGQESAGLEVLEYLRAAVDRPLAVIALTAAPYAGEQGIFLDAGFDGYIGLPSGLPRPPVQPLGLH